MRAQVLSLMLRHVVIQIMNTGQHLLMEAKERTLIPLLLTVVLVLGVVQAPAVVAEVVQVAVLVNLRS